MSKFGNSARVPVVITVTRGWNWRLACEISTSASGFTGTLPLVDSSSATASTSGLPVASVTLMFSAAA